VNNNVRGQERKVTVLVQEQNLEETITRKETHHTLETGVTIFTTNRKYYFHMNVNASSPTKFLLANVQVCLIKIDMVSHLSTIQKLWTFVKIYASLPTCYYQA